jgi:hypothetical protein
MSNNPIKIHDLKTAYPTLRAELYDENKKPNQKEFIFSKFKTEKERIQEKEREREKFKGHITSDNNKNISNNNNNNYNYNEKSFNKKFVKNHNSNCINLNNYNNDKNNNSIISNSYDDYCDFIQSRNKAQILSLMKKNNLERAYFGVKKPENAKINYSDISSQINENKNNNNNYNNRNHDNLINNHFRKINPILNKEKKLNKHSRNLSSGYGQKKTYFKAVHSIANEISNTFKNSNNHFNNKTSTNFHSNNYLRKNNKDTKDNINNNNNLNDTYCNSKNEINTKTNKNKVNNFNLKIKKREKNDNDDLHLFNKTFSHLKINNNKKKENIVETFLKYKEHIESNDHKEKEKEKLLDIKNNNKINKYKYNSFYSDINLKKILKHKEMNNDINKDDLDILKKISSFNPFLYKKITNSNVGFKLSLNLLNNDIEKNENNDNETENCIELLKQYQYTKESKKYETKFSEFEDKEEDIDKIENVAKEILKDCNVIKKKNKHNDKKLISGNGMTSITNGLSVNEFLKKINY